MILCYINKIELILKLLPQTNDEHLITELSANYPLNQVNTKEHRRVNVAFVFVDSAMMILNVNI